MNKIFQRCLAVGVPAPVVVVDGGVVDVCVVVDVGVVVAEETTTTCKQKIFFTKKYEKLFQLVKRKEWIFHWHSPCVLIVKQTLVGFKFEQKIIVKNNQRCQRHFLPVFFFPSRKSRRCCSLFISKWKPESPALSIVANILNSRRVAGKLQYKNECFAIHLNGWSIGLWW